MNEGFVIAVDLGGTWIKGGVVDCSGKIVSKNKRLTEAKKGYNSVKSNILSTVKDLVNGLDAETNINTVVVAVPGWVDNSKGVVKWAPNLFWEDEFLAVDMRNDLGFNVIMLNDADAAALGEYYSRTGGNFKSFLMVTFGTGIGSGYVNQGRLLNGSSGMGIELGHVTVEYNGLLCSCGGRGCLETIVSARALIEKAKKAVEEYREKTQLSSLNEISVESIFAAAINNDYHALELIREVSCHLGIAISNTILILDPEVVILGGGVMSCPGGELILKSVDSCVNENLKRFAGRRIALEKAVLGNDAGIIGAGYYYFKQIDSFMEGKAGR